jgi:hypothetical protein
MTASVYPLNDFCIHVLAFDVWYIAVAQHLYKEHSLTCMGNIVAT